MKFPEFTLCLVLLVGCGGDPQPCDTLCEEGGFSQVDETADGCFCSGGELGASSLDQGACEDYCDALGVPRENAVLATTEEADDTCTCVSE